MKLNNFQRKTKALQQKCQHRVLRLPSWIPRVQFHLTVSELDFIQIFDSENLREVVGIFVLPCSEAKISAEKVVVVIDALNCILVLSVSGRDIGHTD